jgi:hypothetical protein
MDSSPKNVVHHKRSETKLAPMKVTSKTLSYLDRFAVIENPHAAACRYKFLHFLIFIRTGSAKLPV